MKKAGFTLIELLIAIAIMIIIIGSLDQVAARIFSTYSTVQSSQDLVPPGPVRPGADGNVRPGERRDSNPLTHRIPRKYWR